MNELGNSSYEDDTEISLPTPVISDYVQIVYLTVAFCFGAPINVYTFVKLVQRYRITKSRVMLLSIHLNISDLFVLFFNALAKICWLIAYRWTAGWVACKALKFAQSLSLALSSNVVVCIGADRLFSLVQPLQIKSAANRRCKVMLTIGWLLAIVTSAPQIHVYTVYQLTPDWAQCTDVWSIWSHLNISTEHSVRMRTVYGALHLVVVFWLPFIAVAGCYAFIMKKVYKSLGNDEQVQVIRTRSDSAENRQSPNRESNNSYTSSTLDGGIVGCLLQSPTVAKNWQARSKGSSSRTLVNRVSLVPKRSVVNTMTNGTGLPQQQPRPRPVLGQNAAKGKLSDAHRSQSSRILRFHSSPMFKTSLPSMNLTQQVAHQTNTNNNHHHQQQQPLLRRNIGQMRVRRTKYRTLKITIAIVCAYAAFWLPYNCLGLWELIDRQSYLYIEDYVYFFYGLICINAIVNPIIYSRLSFLWCGPKTPSRANFRPSVRFAAQLETRKRVRA